MVEHRAKLEKIEAALEKHDEPKKGLGIGSLRNLMGNQNVRLLDALVVILIIALIGGMLYLQDMQQKIYLEKAEISAPIISLSAQTSGTLDNIYVDEGDEVAPGQKLVKIGDNYVEAKSYGIITYVKKTPGQIVGPQDVLVKMFDPRELRVIGRIAEDKGLADIKPGQRVVFTVDAFGSKQFEGTVESVGTTPRSQDIVFSISDKRQEQEFEVRANFDSLGNPDIKNGMSAKMWVYKSTG